MDRNKTRESSPKPKSLQVSLEVYRVKLRLRQHVLQKQLLNSRRATLTSFLPIDPSSLFLGFTPPKCFIHLRGCHDSTNMDSLGQRRVRSIHSLTAALIYSAGLDISKQPSLTAQQLHTEVTVLWAQDILNMTHCGSYICSGYAGPSKTKKAQPRHGMISVFK